MIPNFPSFKNLEENYMHEVCEYTLKYDPFSDFNFTSMYAWNVDDTTQLSYLNQNLVIKLRDYLENKIILSMLGTHEISKSLEELFIFSGKNKYSINLLPSITVDSLEPNSKIRNIIVADRDQFDYIYESALISSLLGSDFKKRRNLVKKFLSLTSGHARICRLDLKSIPTRRAILDVAEKWSSGKKTKGRNVHQDELVGLERFLKLALKKEYLGVGAFIDQKLIGFSLLEVINNNYAIDHFEKTDMFFPGGDEYLFHGTCNILAEKGIRYLNFEQDLGIEGLRKSKLLWRPVKYLKKYKVANATYFAQPSDS